MTRRIVGKQGWVFPLLSPDSDDRLSLNFHRFVILYISCDTRSVGLGQHCLPKVSNGFNAIKVIVIIILRGYIPMASLSQTVHRWGVWVKRRVTSNLVYSNQTMSVTAKTASWKWALVPNTVCLKKTFTLLKKHRIGTASSYRATSVV